MRTILAFLLLCSTAAAAVPDFAGNPTTHTLLGAGPDDVVLLEGEHVLSSVADDGTRTALLALADAMAALTPPTSEAEDVLVKAIADVRALADRTGGDVTVRSLGIKGKLTVRGTLKVKDLLVYPEGWLDLQPGAKIILRDVPLDLANDPEQWGNGIVVQGKWTASGTDKTDWTRAVAGLSVGRTIEVQDAAGWLSGDRLVISSTKQQPSNGDYLAGTEFRTVESVSGNSVTLTEPLASAHDPVLLDGQIVATAYVGNLTRDIVIRSENPHGVRGHTVIVDHAYCDLRNVEFSGLGRTTTAAIDDTTFDADGNVSHFGTNQRARYPVHAHHHHGHHLDEPHFTFSGCAIDGLDNWQAIKWGLSIHRSYFGVVEDCVCVRFGGSGIMTEDGWESDNVFRHCLAGHIANGPEAPGSKDTGRASAAYWFRGPANIVEDCHAFGAFTGCNYMMYRAHTPLSVRPSARGMHADQSFIITAQPIRYSGESLGCMIGWECWELGGDGDQLFDVPQSTVRFKGFNSGRYGVFLYRTHRVTFQDVLLVNGSPNDKAQGWWLGSYIERASNLQGGATVGFFEGIAMPPQGMCTNALQDTGGVRLSPTLIAQMSDELVSNGAPRPIFAVHNHRFSNHRNVVVNLTNTFTPDGDRLYEFTDCQFSHPAPKSGWEQLDLWVPIAPPRTNIHVNGVEYREGTHNIP